MTTKTIRQRIMEGFRKGWSEDKVVDSLSDEDADVVGDVLTKLKQQRLIPKNKIAKELLKIAHILLKG